MILKKVSKCLMLIILLSFAGCNTIEENRNENSTNQPKAKISIGYYIDSAVSGVEYECGIKKGKTQNDGLFYFEEGKSCVFSIAGITLRVVDSNRLINGKKIFENNLEVARFLQSLDSDNNLDNGISINNEVETALQEALDKYNIGNKIPIEQELQDIISDISEKVKTIDADIPTKDEVWTHLNKTKEEITKELISGKTLYLATKDEYIKLDINQDATKITLTKLIVNLSDSNEVTINGNLVSFLNKKLYINDSTNNYILATDSNNNKLKLFYSDFDALYDMSKSMPIATTNELREAFVGKTYYSIGIDPNTNERYIVKTEYSSNNSTAKSTYIEDSEEITYISEYIISDNTITFKASDSWEENNAKINFIMEVSAKGPLMQTDDILMIAGSLVVMFRTKEAAQAYIDTF